MKTPNNNSFNIQIEENSGDLCKKQEQMISGIKIQYMNNSIFKENFDKILENFNSINNSGLTPNEIFELLGEKNSKIDKTNIKKLILLKMFFDYFSKEFDFSFKFKDNSTLSILGDISKNDQTKIKISGKSRENQSIYNFSKLILDTINSTSEKINDAIRKIEIEKYDLEKLSKYLSSLGNGEAKVFLRDLFNIILSTNKFKDIIGDAYLPHLVLKRVLFAFSKKQDGVDKRIKYNLEQIIEKSNKSTLIIEVVESLIELFKKGIDIIDILNLPHSDFTKNPSCSIEQKDQTNHNIPQNNKKLVFKTKFNLKVNSTEIRGDLKDLYNSNQGVKLFIDEKILIFNNNFGENLTIKDLFAEQIDPECINSIELFIFDFFKNLKISFEDENTSFGMDYTKETKSPSFFYLGNISKYESSMKKAGEIHKNLLLFREKIHSINSLKESKKYDKVAIHDYIRGNGVTFHRMLMNKLITELRKMAIFSTPEIKKDIDTTFVYNVLGIYNNIEPTEERRLKLNLQATIKDKTSILTSQTTYYLIELIMNNLSIAKAIGLDLSKFEI